MTVLTLWAIIAFFAVDTIVVIGVVFWALNRNKGNQNTPPNTPNNTLPNSPFESAFSSSSSSTLNAADGDIVDLLRRGQKIEAIKIYRERTNCGLKEAKDAVEEIERRL